MIYISKDLYEKLRKLINRLGGFEKVDDFVEFILKELITEEDVDKGFSSEEVLKRLKSLGYV